MISSKKHNLVGLSAKFPNMQDASFIFEFQALKYLDLEVENQALFLPKMKDYWNCLQNLSHCKIQSTTVSIAPPFAELSKLTTLILDMPLDGDVQDWAKTCLPRVLEYLIVMHIVGYKRPVSTAFTCCPDLKLLYLVYYGEHPTDTSFIALPPSLKYV